MVLPGLKGDNMEILLIALYVAFFITFVIWGYFMVQSIRGKQPVWKIWVCVAAMWIFNIGIHIVEKFV